jgi:hypothetical protein
MHGVDLGRVINLFLGTYALAGIVAAGIVTSTYWRALLIELGVGVIVYLLVNLALLKGWHTRHHRIIASSAIAITISLFVAAGAAEEYWRELFMSLAAALGLGTALEFLLSNPKVARSVITAADEISPERELGPSKTITDLFWEMDSGAYVGRDYPHLRAKELEEAMRLVDPETQSREEKTETPEQGPGEPPSDKK